MKVVFAVLGSGALLAAGCFSSSAGPDLPDSGETQDAGLDTTVPDAAPAEASPGATPDGMAEASIDATVDAPIEAAVEASADADAGVLDAPQEATPEASSEAAPPGDSGCPTTDAGVPETLCSGVCVDTLSDPSNCGGCGTVCTVVQPSTVSCNTGRCVIALASPALNSGDFAGAIAIDATNVYFTTTADNTPATLQQVPIGGGTATTLVSGTGDEFGGLAVGPTAVYWTGRNQGRIVATPFDGGAGTTLSYGQSCSSYPSTWNCPGSVALRGSTLYWAATGPYTMTSPSIPGDILTESTTGTGATVLVADNTTSGFQIGRVVATATGIFWDNSVENTIQEVAPDGGAITPIVTGPPHYPSDIAADGANVYFVDEGTIYEQPRGSSTPTVLASSQTGAKYITVDATSVYWATSFTADNSIVKAPIAGGPAATLASGLPNLWAIAADGTNVYFSAYTSGGQAQVLQMPAN